MIKLMIFVLIKKNHSKLETRNICIQGDWWHFAKLCRAQNINSLWSSGICPTGLGQCWLSCQWMVSQRRLIRFIQLTETWAGVRSLAWSKLRLCSANHRAGYFSNLACDWLSIAWAYFEQGTENGPWELRLPFSRKHFQNALLS